jgi:WhiB family redox-sensing transcriptional regulator
MTARQIRRVQSLYSPAGEDLADSEPWMAFGLCAETDPEAFFPEKGGSARPAKQVCAGCPVGALCLDYALRTDQRFGIWGGKSERERRKLKQVAA